VRARIRCDLARAQFPSSLSRSWLASGKRAEAQGLLTQACVGITEAPDLPDLVEARTLLAQL
jgi:hypothetical protein